MHSTNGCHFWVTGLVICKHQNIVILGLVLNAFVYIKYLKFLKWQQESNHA